MKREKHSVGDSILMPCSGCGEETKHSIRAVTKVGNVLGAACDVCDTSSTFKAGVKTATTPGNGKKAGDYDRRRRYSKGMAMTHPTFGHGEVLAVLDVQKIDVLFGDVTRRLIHDQR